MKKINLIPEDKNLTVEWSLDWVTKLVRLLDQMAGPDLLDKFCKDTDEKVYVSAKLANQVKRLLIDNNLHTKDKDAMTVVLSAHCDCDGKSPKGG